MYKIKYNFQEITNHTEAYILGFIAADGFVLGPPSNRLGITLCDRDALLLEAITSYISDEIKVSYTSRNGFNSVRFVLCRKEVVNNLKQWGVVPNKTKIDFGLPNISNDFLSSYIRGFFDGDGSIIKYKNSISFYICSPLPKILEEIKTIFDKNEISCKITIDKRKGTHSNVSKFPANYDQYRLVVAKNWHIQRLYNYLYADKSMFLKRKEKVFKECFILPLRNSKDTEFITYNNETKTVNQWAKQLDISRDTLSYRLFNSKWSVEDTLMYRPRENQEPQLKTIKRGHLHPNCKFSESDIINIFNSKDSDKFLSEKYNVHRSTISKIKNGTNCSSITNNIKNGKQNNSRKYNP